MPKNTIKNLQQVRYKISVFLLTEWIIDFGLVLHLKAYETIHIKKINQMNETIFDKTVKIKISLPLTMTEHRAIPLFSETQIRVIDCYNHIRRFFLNFSNFTT